MPKQLTDLRRARGKIQEAYSKIIGRFGTQSEILDLLTEALALIKASDVPGGVEDVPSSTPADTASDGAIEAEAEPPPQTPRKRGMGRKAK
jgi:hypothetical protein